MDAKLRTWGRLRTPVRPGMIVMAVSLVVLFVAGCPNGIFDDISDPDDPSSPTNGTNDDGGETSGRILSYSTNFAVSASDPALSVLYEITGSAPDSIAGFYVAVEDGSPDTPVETDAVREIVGQELPASGSGMSFFFDPEEAGVGYFRVGIRWTVNGEDTEVFSDGVIMVQGLPSPMFVQPAAAVTVVDDGRDVTISFDAGVAGGEIAWRLFYLTSTDPINLPPDELGTTIAIGTGPTGLALFATATLGAGDYEIGVSVTDSGQTIEDTVSAGNLGRIVTVPNSTESGPIITIENG